MDLSTAKSSLADLIDEYLREQGSFDQLNGRLRALHKQLALVPEDKDLEIAFHALQHYIADADIRKKDEDYGEVYGERQRESLRLSSARLRNRELPGRS